MAGNGTTFSLGAGGVDDPFVDAPAAENQQEQEVASATEWNSSEETEPFPEIPVPQFAFDGQHFGYNFDTAVVYRHGLAWHQGRLHQFNMYNPYNGHAGGRPNNFSRPTPVGYDSSGIPIYHDPNNQTGINAFVDQRLSRVNAMLLAGTEQEEDNQDLDPGSPFNPAHSPSYYVAQPRQVPEPPPSPGPVPPTRQEVADYMAQPFRYEDGIPRDLTMRPSEESMAAVWAKVGAAKDRTYGFHPQKELPMIDNTRGVFPSTDPVIRVENVPFNAGEMEIFMFIEKNLMPHFLGGTQKYPIHILMERASGKCLDAWLELPDQITADQVMKRYNSLVDSGKVPRINNRVINLYPSTQGEVMAAIFPRAKDIFWDPVTGIPIKVRRIEDAEEKYSASFRGFLTKEELFMTTQHAIVPDRAAFPQKCLQRVFDSIMATIQKYPWASHYYTIAERNNLFDAYEKMLRNLLVKVYDQDYIDKNGREVGLSEALVNKMTTLGFSCQGFSERQKAIIAADLGKYNIIADLGPFPRCWPFQSLAIPDDVEDEDLEDWMNLFDHGCFICLGDGPTSFSIDDEILMTRDDARYWIVEQKVVQDEAGFDLPPKDLTFKEMVRLETNMLNHIINTAWTSYFEARGMRYLIPQREQQATTIHNKMEKLGCFEEGGIMPPATRKPGDDIVHVPADQKGKWKDLMTSMYSAVPVKSLTESLARVGVTAAPQQEAEHQRIQAVIRGELPVEALDRQARTDSIISSTATSSSGYHGNVRPGFGAWHPGVLDESDSNGQEGASSSDYTANDFNAGLATPIRTGQGQNATWSAPAEFRQMIDFNAIAQQAVATKTPERASRAQQFTTASPFEARQARSVTADRPGVYVPPARRGSPERTGMFRRGSPERAGIPVRGRVPEASPTRGRGRSKSPSKRAYIKDVINDTFIEPVRNLGAIGTPSRRGRVVKNDPTIAEVDEEDARAAGADAKGKGRAD